MEILTENKKLAAVGLRIAKLLKRGGYQAFWVGGTVRDMLLGRMVDNIDIATSATPDQVEALLGKEGINTKPVGKAYGTILAPTDAGPVEITTFRKEGRYLDRRHPHDIEFVSDYREDAKRRDITMNALYLDAETGKVLDPQGGGKDIRSRIIRFVGNPKKRIDEDALRMLRAARLAVQLNFKLEKNAFAAIKTRAKYIQGMSGERIKAELDKILALPNKGEGVRLLDDLGILRFIMPEVAALKKTWHKSRKYHLEGSAFEHAMLTLEKIKPGSVELAYAALYHDVGKAVTALPKDKPEGRVISFPGHEYASADMFLELSKRLKFPRKQAQLILWITKMHMTRSAFVRDMRPAKKIVLASHKHFTQLIELWKADALANYIDVEGRTMPSEPLAYEQGRQLLANINANNALAEKLSRGEFIMRETKINSGPIIGRIKRELRNEIILGNVKNISGAKKFLKKFHRHA